MRELLGVRKRLFLADFCDLGCDSCYGVFGTGHLETRPVGCHYAPINGELGMCQSCIDIDNRIERYRQLLRLTTDTGEIERINRLIAKLYADRVLLHQNPER